MVPVPHGLHHSISRRISAVVTLKDLSSKRRPTYCWMFEIQRQKKNSSQLSKTLWIQAAAACMHVFISKIQVSCLFRSFGGNEENMETIIQHI
jgi:hypothetical protein